MVIGRPQERARSGR